MKNAQILLFSEDTTGWEQRHHSYSTNIHTYIHAYIHTYINFIYTQFYRVAVNVANIFSPFSVTHHVKSRLILSDKLKLVVEKQLVTDEFATNYNITLNDGFFHLCMCKVCPSIH